MNRRDALLTAGVGLLVLGVTTVAARHQPDARPLDVGGYALLVAGVASLLWRSRFPVTVFVCSAIAVWTYYLADFPGGPAAVAPTIALFTVARLAGPVTAAIAGAGAFGVVFVGDFVANGQINERLVGFAAWLTAVIGLGTAIRQRRATNREHRRRLVEEERLRIAREVHDVVAHSLAMISVQAGVGAHVADRRPEEAKAALLAIRDASRTALTDLRATLDLLRSGDGPLPGLHLLADLTAPGLTVTVHGEPGALPPAVDAAAYRIVQESVTNTVRHASGAGSVTVRFTREADMLDIVITDDGAVVAEPVPGNGLGGMRERAVALGGTFHAGPGTLGGFEVHAVLPIREVPR